MGAVCCNNTVEGLILDPIKPEPPDSPNGARWQHEWIGSPDGVELYCSIWDAPSRIQRKAVMVYAHGTAFHCHMKQIENELFRPLADAGICIYAYDKRGHGRTGQAAISSGYLGDTTDRIEDFLTVIEAARNHFGKSAPIYLAGHSLGAAEILMFLGSRHSSTEAQLVRGAVLYQPGIGDIDMNVAAVIFFRMMGTLAIHMKAASVEAILREHCMGGDGWLSKDELLSAFSGETLQLKLSALEISEMTKLMNTRGDGKVSIDEFMAHAKVMDQDYWIWAHVPLSTAKDLADLQGMYEKIPFQNISKPLLLMHGPHDKVNTLAAAQDVMNRTSSQVTVQLKEDLRHGLVLNEKDGREVAKDTLEWFEEQLMK